MLSVVDALMPPSQSVRTMELVLSGLAHDVCLCYLGDILIFSFSKIRLENTVTDCQLFSSGYNIIR